ncbi:MAG TPA: homoserine kinase [Candidatus Polarisedimenticolia bacterium]|nr:homoserine kinase [Candidatus Polarisedimenticolia bacterium]
MPGSTSNLGPGFDCLGLALRIPMTVTAERIPSGFEIRRRGEGSDLAVDPHKDVVLGAFRHLFRVANRPVPTVSLTIDSEIPLARGLGSSAAAIVAGLTLANHWMNGRFSRDEIFREATRLEGHPDNVAPAIYGGLTLALPLGNGEVEALRLPLPRGLAITLAIPAIRVSTKKARALLPAVIPLKEAAANTARALALEEVLRARRYDLLAEALRDVYHVPYRARLIPGFDGVVEAGRRAGAYGVTISGSGPTMLAFHAPGRGSRVGNAMVRAFARQRVEARSLVGRIATTGAVARTLRNPGSRSPHS